MISSGGRTRPCSWRILSGHDPYTLALVVDSEVWYAAGDDMIFFFIILLKSPSFILHVNHVFFFPAESVNQQIIDQNFVERKCEPVFHLDRIVECCSVEIVVVARLVNLH